MTKIHLNNHPLKFHAKFKPTPYIEPFYGKHLKYGDIKFNKYITDIIDYMFDLIEHKRKYQHIFVRSDNFTVGQYTSNGMWHLDSLLNGGEFENFLFVSNETTEFMTNPQTIEPQLNGKEFNKAIIDPSILKLPERTVCQYDGYTVHRGVRVTKDTNRLLVRVQNTDKAFNPIVFKR